VNDALRGILLSIAATLIFSVSDAIGKHIAMTYGPLMVSFARFVFSFATILLIFPLRLGEAVRTRRPGLQVARSLAVIGANTLFFIGLRYNPLADMVAIGAATPFITTILAIVLLGEKVGVRRWTAMGIGFVGLLIIVRPGLEVRDWTYFMPIASGTFWSVYVILTRKAGGVDPPLTQLFYAPLAGSVAMSAAAPFYWEMPQGHDWALLVVIGTCATIGHLVLIKAYRLAAASVIAPYAYVNIVFATIIGYLVYGDFPDHWTLVGTAVVVGSGIYVFYREAQLARAARGGS